MTTFRQHTAMGLVLVALFVLTPISTGSAQTSTACEPATGPYIVTSGRPFTTVWLMDAKVPASPQDPTLVDQRIDGFYLQVDNGPKVDIGKPAPGTTCTGPLAGKIPYSFRVDSGVGKGAHTATLSAYNFQLNPDGSPTTVKQEGPAVSVPFSAVDPVQVGAPLAPVNITIWR